MFDLYLPFLTAASDRIHAVELATWSFRTFVEVKALENCEVRHAQACHWSRMLVGTGGPNVLCHDCLGDPALLGEVVGDIDGVCAHCLKLPTSSRSDLN